MSVLDFFTVNAAWSGWAGLSRMDTMIAVNISRGCSTPALAERRGRPEGMDSVAGHLSSCRACYGTHRAARICHTRGILGRLRPRSRVSRMAAIVFTAAALAASAACSSQAPAHRVSPVTSPRWLQAEPGGQILRTAGRVMEALRSVRVSGRVSGVSFEEFLASPCQASGTFSFHGGGALNVIRLGDILYFRGNQEFYRSLGVGVPPHVGRWRVSTVRSALRAGLLRGPQGCMKAFLSIWTLPKVPASVLKSITKGATRTVRGQPAITLLDSRNDALYVAANGTPYLLAVALHGGSYLNFSRFNRPVTITAPPSCPPSSRVPASSGAALVC
jgi:hypothetical protein